jgi:hypothetical protein
MDRVTFMARLDDKFLGELPIGNPGKRSTRVESVAAGSPPN